jgi:hypothetical protein
MSDEPLAREREPIERVRARLEALVMANAAPRCGARSKRTGKPCRAAAMPNGRCKVHGGKSTGPRTPEGLERSRFGPVIGSRCFALQIWGEGRAPHVNFLRAFGVHRRSVRWIFDSA